MSLQTIQKNILETLAAIPQKEVSIEQELLSIHQGVDQLWAVYRENKGMKPMEEKAASVVITALLAIQKIGVENIDEVVADRLKTIRTSPYRGTLDVQ